MITLIPLSDHPFYLWQALVQHAAGVKGTWLIYRHNRQNSRYLDAFQRSGASTVVWDDWRISKTYNPMMKPALVGHWLTANQTDEDVLVIDPDVIPTGRQLPVGRRNVILGTDTDWYTGPAWLQSKRALEPICEYLEVDPDDASAYLGIGAQYIFKGIPGEFWLEVAEKSVAVYEILTKHPIDAQAWCAEMYVTHILAVKYGYQPTPSSNMSMMWANGSVQDWDTTAFFHDAGQPIDNHRDFHKGTYQLSPFRKTIRVAQESASSRYVELIKETEVKFPNIIW